MTSTNTITPGSTTGNPFTHIAVLGAGTMGSGIALAGLCTGLHVSLYDIAPEMLAKAKNYIDGFLAKKGQQAASERLALTSTLDDLAGCQVIMEAAPEKLDLKRDLFGKLSRIAPDALLATNTSTLSVTEIVAAADNPARGGGMHFFNPAPVMQLVEVVRAAQSSEATVAALADLARQMGKTPVICQDTPGFIVNRVARPFYLEALRIVSEGIATPEQVDTVMMLGGGFRMGPFALMDLIGLDVSFAATQSVFERTFYEPRFRPSLLQAQMVAAGRLGRKTGKGFYDYGPDAKPFTLPDIQPMRKASGEIMVYGNGKNALIALCEQAGYRLVSPGTLWGSRSRGMGKGKSFPEGGSRPRASIVGGGMSVLRDDLTLVLHEASIGGLHAGSMFSTFRETAIGVDELFAGPVVTLAAAAKLKMQTRKDAQDFFTGLGCLPIWISDAPGLILPRIISQIVNEAAFAVGEGVADRGTVDTAVRLGLNWPRGPFEWLHQLRVNNVVAVLNSLYKYYREERYRIAPALRRLSAEE